MKGGHYMDTKVIHLVSETKLVTRVAKSGNPYQMLVTSFKMPNGDTYDKEVFLDKSEVALFGLLTPKEVK